MSGDSPSNPIDEYIDALDEPKRTTLRLTRDAIAAVLPDAEQCLAYGAPAFRVCGKAVAGFAAFRNHLSYLPHSGTVLDTLGDAVAGFDCSKGALKFAVDEPLPRGLLHALIEARLAELGCA